MRYRKKPVVVNAEQFRASTYMQSDFLKAVVQDKAHLGEMWFGTTAADGRYYIYTLEGHMMVSEGDYIIEGVEGEFYPCKPDIFEKTYELVV